MENPAKKQQIQFFIKELIAFAILFLTLGFVVYFFFHVSVYHNIDQGLYSQRHEILRNSGQAQFKRDPFRQNNRPGPNRPPANNAPFRTNIITFNQKGEVANTSMLGMRNYELLSQIPLNKKALNKVQDLALSNNDLTSHFRTLLIKAPNDNPNPEYAGKYVLIIENVDADLLAVNSFKMALIITLVLFWLLAITIAYLLSKSSMKPIIRSWNKQRDFSANAAHELRTPLTVIQNQLEYMFTKPNAKVVNQAQPIATSLDEVRHLRTLTSRLLTLARSDANLIQIKRQDINVKKWLKQILPPYQDMAQYQDKVLQTNFDIQSGGNFDPDLMQELLVILFDNALKYTPKHGSIEVNISQISGQLKIDIADTGKGISDEDKDKIFDRFYRGDKSRSKDTGGNGLGLTMAQWIVHQHHGKIHASNNYPHGTIFHVQIRD